MRQSIFSRVVLSVTLIGFSAGASELEDTIQKLPAKDAPSRDALNASLFKDGPATIQALSKLLLDSGKGDDSKARLALHAMAIHASRPGGDAERKVFAQAAATALASDVNAYGKAYLLTQLRLTASDDQIPAIAALLADKELSEDAAQSLMTINTPAAKTALRDSLKTVKDMPRVTVINALGTLRDSTAAVVIRADASSPDAALRNAALFALANIGDADATEGLKKAVDAAGADKWYERSQATQAQLTLASRLAENGQKDSAAALCRELIQTRTDPKERHIQCAALNILAGALGADAFEDLKKAMKNESIEVRASALNIAGTLPGQKVTTMWAAEMTAAEPAYRAEILKVLRKRNDASAYPDVAKALNDPDPAVRAAAVAATVIGGQEALPGLLAALAKDSKDNGEEVAAARLSLARLKGEKVNAGIAAALKGAAPGLRKALIIALSDRAAVEHISALNEATKDADPAIRAVAYESLGSMGDIKIFPALLDTIVKTGDDADRTAAEKAASAIASRGDAPVTTALISEALKGAPVKARQALLRVLGKIGGEIALNALKPALADADPEAADVAIRELANWPDISALSTQLEVAKDPARTLPHHALSIIGHIRLLGTLSKRPSNELLPMYQTAIEACRRADEKKKVIAGIQTIKSAQALKAVEALIAEKDLKAEASNAYFNIAKDLAKSDKKTASEAFQKIIASDASEARKKDAQTELDKIKK